MERHPRISLRVSNANNRKHAREWTSARCDAYIEILTILDAEGYMTDPNGMWNGDETACQLAETYKKVFAERGSQEVVTHYDGDDKARVTVMVFGNSAGRILKPLILHDGKVHLASRFEGTDDKVLLTVNVSGYMDEKIFAEYIKREVIPNMTATKVGFVLNLIA